MRGLQIVWLFWLVTLAGCSEGAIKAAGVIVVAEHEGVQYLLLANHTGMSAHRGYGAFGGGLDKDETLQQGALREFHEETACHFVNQPIEMTQEYVRNGKYVSFVIWVPYISETRLNGVIQSDACKGKVYSERSLWRWVEKNAFLQQIQTKDEFDTGSQILPLWDKSTVIFKKAQVQGLL